MVLERELDSRLVLSIHPETEEKEALAQSPFFNMGVAKVIVSALVASHFSFPEAERQSIRKNKCSRLTPGLAASIQPLFCMRVTFSTVHIIHTNVAHLVILRLR